MDKALIIADPHIHTWEQFGLSSDGRMFKRLAEQINVFDQITETIFKEEIKVVIVAGDLCHKVGEVPIEALNVVGDFFSKWRYNGVKIYFVDGNHDIIDRKNPEWYESINTLFDEDEGEPEGVKFIHFCDEVDYASIKGHDLVVVHQTPIGARIGNFEFKNGVNWKELAAHNKMVVFGHIHQRQELAPNCHILGAPMHLNFRDTGDRGVHIYEDGKLRFVKLNSPKFITVETSADVVKGDGNYYRVLHAEERSEDTNVINIVKPKYFEERLKNQSFHELLSEWVEINKKPKEYLEVLKPIIDEKFQLVKKVFKGTIQKIVIKDFLSIANLELNVRDGFIYIKGANGAGKSSIFEAVYWALYGKTTKGLTGDDILRDKPTLQENAVVEVFLGNGNGQGLIRRTRKTGLEVYKNVKDEVPVTEGMLQGRRQSLLEELLGIPEGLFLGACYFSQENLKMLTGMGDTDKTNLITDMLGFEIYDDLKNKCHEQIKDYNINELPGYDSEIIEYEKQLAVYNSQYKSTEQDIIDLENRRKFFENNKIRYEEEIAKLEKEILKLPTLESKKYLSIGNIEKHILSLEEDKINLKNSILVLEKEKEQLDVALLTNRTEISALDVQCNLNSDILTKLKTKIAKLDTLVSGDRCDSCNTLITEENRKIHQAEKRKEEAELTNLNIPLVAKSREFGLESKRIENKIFELNLNKRDLVNHIDNTEGEIKQANNKIAEIKEFEYERKGKEDNIRHKINMQEASIEMEFKTKVEVEMNIIEKKGALKDIMSSREFAMHSISGVNNKIKTVSSNIEKLEFWKEAFSSRGIRALLLDNFCNEFNSIIAKYVSLVSNGELTLLLNPKSMTKKGEERNELGLDITNKGAIRKYQSLSGGEKRRVDVSLCLSLNKWAANRHELPSGLLGILILDELFSYVDHCGEETIGNLLREEGINKAVFVVAHTSSLESFATEVKEVYKTTGETTEMIKGGEW